MHLEIIFKESQPKKIFLSKQKRYARSSFPTIC